MKKAISNIKSLPRKDATRLKINPNKKISKEYICKLFQIATLHNPNTTTRLVNHLFEINIPKISEDEMAYALKVRNAYTHNNGFIDNKKVEISIQSLEAFHEKIDSLIGNFVGRLLDEIKNFVNKTKD